MTDRIPDEIMREAGDIVEAWVNETGPNIRIAIAHALMARDQRAAEIARKMFINRRDMPGQLAFAAGSEIAQDILSYDEAQP